MRNTNIVTKGVTILDTQVCCRQILSPHRRRGRFDVKKEYWQSYYFERTDYAHGCSTTRNKKLIDTALVGCFLCFPPTMIAGPLNGSSCYHFSIRNEKVTNSFGFSSWFQAESHWQSSRGQVAEILTLILGGYPKGCHPFVTFEQQISMIISSYVSSGHLSAY